MNLFLTLIYLACNLLEFKVLLSNVQKIDLLVIKTTYKMISSNLKQVAKSAYCFIFNIIKKFGPKLSKAYKYSRKITGPIEDLNIHYLAFICTGSDIPTKFI